jgi:hypothetical protein
MSLKFALKVSNPGKSKKYKLKSINYFKDMHSIAQIQSIKTIKN